MKKTLLHPPGTATSPPATRAPLHAVAGEAMDEPLARGARPWHRRHRPVLVGLAAVLLMAMAVLSYVASGEPRLRLPAGAVTISVVSAGSFDDFVPVRAQAVPASTTYVDAAQQGQVERTFAEEGTRVTRGQVLVKLVNPSFELELLSRNAESQQRLNDIKEAEVALERQRLEDETRLSDSAYRAKLARSELDKQRVLNQDGFVSDALVRRAEDESRFAEDSLDMRRRGAQKSEALMAQQHAQLRVQAAQLRDTLAGTRRLLDGLVVRAPSDGTLTGFNLKPGQSIAAGMRVAQIDGGDGFKLLGSVDEYYLARVAVGQTASLANSPTAALQVGRVLPQVVNGQFQMELVYLAGGRVDLRRGQTVELRLNLGAPTQALLLPNGAFLADSGGAFVYRLDAGGVAQKTPVQLGRRNVRSVEVLSGLQRGDRVITSSYADYTRLSAVAIEGAP